MFCMSQGLSYLDKTALNYGNLWVSLPGLVLGYVDSLMHRRLYP